MIVEIPQDISDITLTQSQALNKLKEREGVTPYEFNKRAIHILTGIPYNQVDNIKIDHYEGLINDIVKALNTECEFTPIFEMNGKEYGMIPNFDKMSQGEFMDICEYEKKPEDLNKLMAVLFRPVTNKDRLGNYKIEPYESTADRAELFKDIKMHIVNGALGFFLTLSDQLKKAIQRYTIQELRRDQDQQTTSLSGDGMLRS